MSVTITALEAENVKRIKAVALTPAPTGLTLVGGNNNQGKVPGIAKGVDLSVAYKDYAGIIQRAGLGQVRG